MEAPSERSYSTCGGHTRAPYGNRHVSRTRRVHAADCHVCRSESFQVQARVKVSAGARSIIATLNVVSEAMLPIDAAALSEVAWKDLQVREGETLNFAHPEPLESFSSVRRKIYGIELGAVEFDAIIRDIVAGRYSPIELAAILTTCAGERMSLTEVVSLTHAMVAAGSTLAWSATRVVDKHCIGGLPGNRATAVRHVAEQEARITRQELLIEHLREVGAPSDDALRFLDSMQECLETMRTHVARL
jgi:hypothetical protein